MIGTINSITTEVTYRALLTTSTHLKDLGVTAVWLTPWYDNYDHPNEIELKEGEPSTGFHGYNPQDF